MEAVQLTLNLDAESRLDKRFANFHNKYPQVYKLLVRLSRELKDAGRAKIGIKMLWEVLRWQISIGNVADDTGFKLPNDYTSRYARLIMQQEPDLNGIFETRHLRS